MRCLSLQSIACHFVCMVLPVYPGIHRSCWTPSPGRRHSLHLLLPQDCGHCGFLSSGIFINNVVVCAAAAVDSGGALLLLFLAAVARHQVSIKCRVVLGFVRLLNFFRGVRRRGRWHSPEQLVLRRFAGSKFLSKRPAKSVRASQDNVISKMAESKLLFVIPHIHANGLSPT